MPNYKFEMCAGCVNRLYSNPPFPLRGDVARRCRRCELDVDGRPTNIVPYREWFALPQSTKASLLELPDRSPSVAPVCETCPLHLEADDWRHLRTFSGRPLVCSERKKAWGCGNGSIRGSRIATFRRHQRAHELGVHPVALLEEGVEA